MPPDRVLSASLRDTLARHEAICTRAMELLSGGWCRGSYATDADGNRVFVTDRRAVRFCLLGAIRRAAREHGNAWEPVALCFRIQHEFPVGYRHLRLDCYNDRIAENVWDVRNVLYRVRETVRAELARQAAP